MCIPLVPCRIDLPYPSELKIHCGPYVGPNWADKSQLMDGIVSFNDNSYLFY